MNRIHVSESSIEIKTKLSDIWHTLTDQEIAKKYFFGAEIITDWQEGSSIIFRGSYNGNKYEEKGVLLNVKPELQLQYTHWSDLEGIPDIPENYRIWTFDLIKNESCINLSITEDNIPTQKQKLRSDEFWSVVLIKIKSELE